MKISTVHNKILKCHHENKSPLLAEMGFHSFHYTDLNMPDRKNNEQTDSYFRKYELFRFVFHDYYFE